MVVVSHLFSLFKEKFGGGCSSYELHPPRIGPSISRQPLEKLGIEVVTTKTHQNTNKGLYERGAASKGCHLFLSVHSNAVAGGINENIDYPVAYVLLNGSSTDIGLKLSKVVEDVMGTLQKGRTATRRGSNGEYYGVLRGADAVGTPGVILEHSFHTNTRSTKWLLNDANLQKLAKAEAECIAAHFGTEAEKHWYRVQRRLLCV